MPPKLKCINNVLLAGVVLMSLLSSCTKKFTEEVKPTPLPNPQPQLPDKLCAHYVSLGYTNKVSYFAGEQITAFLQSENQIDLCRLDVYDANGALAFSVPSTLFQQQTNKDAAVNGFGFMPSATFTIPSDLVSGLYKIENKIPFIVKTKDPVDLMIVYPSNTINAYCESGGRSLYTKPPDRPYQVSFERPMEVQSFSTQCITWFAKQKKYKIGYVADIDLDDYNAISNSKILIVIGHNEYWTRAARINFDSFVDMGKHAIILSGNTMWWQVRYSDDKTKLICYRSDADPISQPELTTINWYEPSLSYSILSSIAADFSHGGYGLKADKGWNGYKIVTPESPLLEGLKLAKGDIISLPTVEYDGLPISDLTPEGYPVIDRQILNVDKIEMIGFDKGFRVTETYGTFFVLKRSQSSGIIVNTCTTDWCSDGGMGGSSGDKIKIITQNAIDKLMNNQSVFSDNL